ncbi:ARM repeat superfamily protein [Rhynchospora pubera]|uniref:ARM repeat superfamily protein n=1 Tax=Rhynchospora pubera TaxID=906938 RepID=A0AAV8HZX3_9POAL|nr:ARM repeat superfamily protein [Rhynchospora pubera]
MIFHLLLTKSTRKTFRAPKMESDKEGGETAIQVSTPVKRTPKLARGGGSTTFFQPQDPRESTPGSSNDSTRPVRSVPAPEKKLTLFALRLAVLEKAASGLGTLAFIWATVVLLGGFAIFVSRMDFWVVTVILVSEGARIFSRSHELEWQHQSTWTLARSGSNSFRMISSSSRFLWRALKALFNPLSAVEPEHDQDRQIRENAAKAKEFQKKLVRYQTMRAWHAPEVPLLPYSGWVFLSKNISRWLSWLQIVSAFNCIALSLFRLIVQDYGKVDKEEKHNRGPALNLFYSVALTEATLFLVEKIYWTYKISHHKLLERVSTECNLGADGLITIRRFFYDAYSRCVEGSIFDGIRMDLVSFAEELLDSAFLDEQYIAVRILQKLVRRNNTLSVETVRKIETNTRVIERLVEMLNWKASEEQEIRKAAAEILTELAHKHHSALRVAGIPGAMESISSLLNKSHQNFSYDYSEFNLLGLLMLKRLARDHDNCFKIGNTRRLLPRVIEFTSDAQRIFQNELVLDSRIKTINRSLKVVKMLVETSGSAGKILREEISNIVITVSNMRNILEYGHREIKLQRLAIEVLTGLAMDENAKERIASTGGVIRLLFSIFSSPGVEEESSVRTEAGECIAMLALESQLNCSLILKKVDVSKLVDVLGDRYLRLNALRILRNLCAYSGDECSSQLKGVVAAMPSVLKITMNLEERDKLLEVAIGLTYQICKFTSTSNPEYFIIQLGESHISEENYVETLIKILSKYEHPSLEVPRIRRFVVLQATWMMENHKHFVKLFNQFDIRNLLERVGDTTSDLECFHVFSGSVGISRHRENLSTLVEKALEHLFGGSCSK